MEHGTFGGAVGEQRFDDFLVRVAVVDLHGQVEFLGERDVGTERFALQFLGGFASAEQVHAGFADGDDLVGVGGGEAVHFGHGFVEGDVVPRLVFDGQAVGAGCAAVAVQHGFVGVYGDCGVHGSGMLAGHVDGGHEVGQLATAVDYAFDTDVLSLFQQFVDAVDGYFALAFFHGFVTHGLGEGHDGCDVGVVVDDVRVFGQRLWGRGPIAIAVVLAHVFQISPDWPCTAGELSFEGSNEGPPVSRHTRHLIVMVVNDHAGAV